MHAGFTGFRPTLRAGLLGLISGVLSCLLVESRILYVPREQKTYDHVVWPGLVFAVVVLVPLSRWAGDGCKRIATVLIASSAVYPLAWRIATAGLAGPSSRAVVTGEFALAGFVGSGVLSSVFLSRRPGWLGSAAATVVIGAVTGGLTGANVWAAIAVSHWPVPVRDALGLTIVVWQTVVGASLARGVERRLRPGAGSAGSLPRPDPKPVGKHAILSR